MYQDCEFPCSWIAECHFWGNLCQGSRLTGRLWGAGAQHWGLGRSALARHLSGRAGEEGSPKHCVAYLQTERSRDRQSQNLIALLCKALGEMPWCPGRNTASRPGVRRTPGSATAFTSSRVLAAPDHGSSGDETYRWRCPCWMESSRGG